MRQAKREKLRKAAYNKKRNELMQLFLTEVFEAGHEPGDKFADSLFLDKYDVKWKNWLKQNYINKPKYAYIYQGFGDASKNRGISLDMLAEDYNKVIERFKQTGAAKNVEPKSDGTNQEPKQLGFVEQIESICKKMTITELQVAAKKVGIKTQAKTKGGLVKRFKGMTAEQFEIFNKEYKPSV